MPAPNRRNKGEALAHQIKAHAAAKSMGDRDSLVASRTRHAKKFEEAQARLSRAGGSTLEQRASQAHADYERGLNLDRFSRSVREGRAKPPVVVLAPETSPRYFLGECLRCSREMRVHSAKPRVPIHPECRR
ncbi:hypothetical protein [Nocardioides ochotonae]|uniref:hypothetical protein n=1 Tax=Nocardioides ochotonae TaxID=2685869 RepID=UPI00140BAE0E|nr:hypothetical protein [Nocardioides ochotonae]